MEDIGLRAICKRILRSLGSSSHHEGTGDVEGDVLVDNLLTDDGRAVFAEKSSQLLREIPVQGIDRRMVSLTDQCSGSGSLEK